MRWSSTPTTPTVIWVGVEVGGVARSSDGGQSWKVDLPGDNPDIHMMFAHPVEPGVLFVSTGYGRFDGVAEELEGNAGVFRSADYGETWEYVWKGMTPRYSRPLCIDRRDPYSVTVASAPTAFSHVTRTTAGRKLPSTDQTTTASRGVRSATRPTRRRRPISMASSPTRRTWAGCSSAPTPARYGRCPTMLSGPSSDRVSRSSGRWRWSDASREATETRRRQRWRPNA